MKIVIIGASGMLGQELARVFQNENPELWDREEIDIADEQDVSIKIAQAKPDLVLNAAAYNDVDGAEQNQPLADKINGFAPGYLAKAISASRGILVHYSTGYVFKGDNKNGYSEGDKPDPQSAYARSKYLGEQEVQKYTSKYYVIRTSRLFGKPASSRQGKKSFVELMLNLADTKPEINAVDEELDSPTYVKDLAVRTKEIIEQNKPFGIYHVTNAGSCTWYGFAREIFTQKNISVKLNPVSGSLFPRAARRPQYTMLLNTKLPTMRRWQEALNEFLNPKFRINYGKKY